MGTSYWVSASGTIPLKNGVTECILKKVSGYGSLDSIVVTGDSIRYKYEDESKWGDRLELIESFITFVEENYAQDAWFEHYEWDSDGDYGGYQSGKEPRGPQALVKNLRLVQIEEELAELEEQRQTLLCEQRTLRGDRSS
jgi:hypothetical protein